MRLDSVHRQKQLSSDCALGEVAGEESQHGTLGRGGLLDGLLEAGARLAKASVDLVDKSSESSSVRERVELLAGDFEFRFSDREAAAGDARLCEHQERVDVVQAWLWRAAQGLRAFKFTLGVLRLPELEQRLAERVVCETGRDDAREPELAYARNRLSCLGLGRVWVPGVALQQRA